MSTGRIDSDSVHTEHSFMMYPTVQENTTSGVVYSVENFVHTMINRDTNGAERTDTTPTASQIVNHMKSVNSASQTSSSSWTYVHNSGSHNLTITAGTGVTLYGSMTISPSNTVLLLIKIEDDTNEQVSVYRL